MPTPLIATFWTPQVTAAFISGGVTILLLGGKEVVFDRLSDRRRSVTAGRLVYRRYADPILHAAQQLLWRLNEILDGGRGDYLKGRSAKTTYEHYKTVSTIYRLAMVLAWIRALQRELFFLPLRDQGRRETVDAAIGKLRNSLADGSHVEQQRLESLLTLWHLSRKSDVSVMAVGAELDTCIKRHLHSAGVSIATELSEGQQLDLCKEASALLAKRLSSGDLPDALVAETVNQAVQRISIRETWIYADWQAAIGDVLLLEAPAGDRRYEVVGFRLFEAMLTDGTDEEKRWLRRLYALIEDLDISGDDRFDARVGQLREIYLATAQLVLALSAAEVEVRSDPKTLGLAHSVVNRCART